MKKLRAEVGSLSRNAAGRRRYDAGLCGRLVSALNDWTASGESIESFAREVDVRSQLLIRWQKELTLTPPPIREVAVGDAPEAPHVSSSIRLTLSRGGIVEGLSVADLIAYSRALAPQ